MQTTTSPSLAPRKRQKRASTTHAPAPPIALFQIMVTYKDPMFPSILSAWHSLVRNSFQDTKEQEISLLQHPGNEASMQFKKYTCVMMMKNRIICSIQSEYLDYTQPEGRDKFKQWVEEAKVTTQKAWNERFYSF